MSFRVVSEVLERSRVDNSADLSVLVAIAEIAHHDGVGWLPQGPRDDPKSIAYRSRNPLRTVERSIADLEWNLELEVRRYQRGRKRLNVYRILSGQILQVEVDYERLPFQLDAPFSSPEEILELRTARQAGGWSRRSPAATVAAGRAVDDPPNRAENRGDGPPMVAGHRNGPLDPVQTREPETGSLVPAEAGEGEDRKVEISLALSAALGVRLQGMTRGERGAWERAVDELADVDATGAQVTARCLAYRTVWPDARLTPLALVKYWSLLGLEVDTAAAADPLAAWLEKAPGLFERQTAHELLDDRPNLATAERLAAHARLDELFDERERRAA